MRIPPVPASVRPLLLVTFAALAASAAPGQEAPPPAAAEALARAEKAFGEGALDDAIEAAKEAAEGSPKDARPWLLRARCERLLAARAAEAGDGTTAQLRLLDAVASARSASGLAPRDPEAWREVGRSLRDSSKFAEAAGALRNALDLAPGDGETLYDLGYCVAYAGDFKDALALFRKAGEKLGPDVRVAVNAAICEERLGDRKAAVDRLAGFYAREVAAGRGGDAGALQVLDKVWELTVQRKDYEAGKSALSALADAHASRPEPAHMLGNLLAFRGDQAGAADAYARSLKAADRPATRLRRVRALLAAGKRAEADAAIREGLDRHPKADGVREAALEVGRALLADRDAAGARGLAAAALRAFADDADLLVLEGDGSMAEGDLPAALHGYRRACEASSLHAGAAARVARAELAATRSGVRLPVDMEARAAPGTPLDPAPPAEALMDFEEPRVYVRAETPSGGEGRILEGAMRLRSGTGTATGESPPAGGRGGRNRPPAAGALLRVEFYPFLDTTAWGTLAFRARAEGGKASLRVAILDGYDEAGSGFARSRWPAEGSALAVGAAWAPVAVPLKEIAGFVPSRPLRPLLQRVRCLLLQVETAGDGPAPAVFLDDLVLRGPGGKSRVLAAFEESPAETLVVYGGACVPFERTLFTESDAKGFKAPGTVVCARHVLGDSFDPSFVGRGKAALRVHHGEGAAAPAGPAGRAAGASAGGASTVEVVLRPPPDFARFRAVTFLARGAKGGERLRVRLRDGQDADLEGVMEAGRWPAAVFPRTAKEDGALALSKGWRMYRIPFAAYPEIDRAAFAGLVFECGADVGNGSDATVFLDEIGMEL